MTTKKITTTALLSSLSLVLAFIEGQFIIIPACPGVRLGLSNVAVMFALLFIDKKTAFGIAFIKALFAFATRGAMAGVLSLSGGVFSISVLSVLLLLNASLSVSSVFGALSHNLAQFTVITLVYGGVSFIPYLPILIASGVVFGSANAVLLRVITPYFKRIMK